MYSAPIIQTMDQDGVRELEEYPNKEPSWSEDLQGTWTWNNREWNNTDTYYRIEVTKASPSRWSSPEDTLSSSTELDSFEIETELDSFEIETPRRSPAVELTGPEIMDHLCNISQKKKMKVAIPRTKRGSAILIAGVIIGISLTNPLALLLGGTIGGTLGAWVMLGSFKPASEILKMLPSAEREKLIYKATDIIRDVDAKGPDVDKKLLDMLKTYFTKELKARIEYGD